MKKSSKYSWSRKYPDHETTDLIRKVRRYTRRFPELCAAHHFSFDLPLDSNTSGADCVVLGVNPGETKADKKVAKGPTEETRDYDYQREFGRSPASKKWMNRVHFFLPNSRVILGDMFFWSSSSVDEFRGRFGKMDASNPHLRFCARMNEELLDRYKPRLVVCPGLNSLAFAALLYGLKFHDARDTLRGHRLIVDCRDQAGRPWVFTKHWSGSWLSDHDKKTISAYLRRYLTS